MTSGYRLSARAAEAEARRVAAERGVTRLSVVPREPIVPRVDAPATGVSHAALALAGRAMDEAPPVLDLPKPPPGVAPQMAFDYQTDAYKSLATWALQGMRNEGQTFLGYPYLAQLAQRAEYRHAAEIWAEHATRRWVKFKGPNDDEIGELEAFMENGLLRGDEMLGGWHTRDTFRQAAEHDAIFGRSQIFLDTGRIADRGKRLTTASRVKSIRVIEPLWVYPANYDTSDPLDEWFYRPRTWHVYGQEVDASRFLTFVGHEVSDVLKPVYAFGGLSLVQMMKPYVDNWLRTRQSVSDMTHSYSTMTLATDMSSTLMGGAGDELFKRVDLFNKTRDNRGTMVIDKDGETLENVSTPISGLDKLQAQAQEQMASVARIPLSIYLQVTPTGLNASTDGEVRSFYADIHAYQERCFRTPLSVLVDHACVALWGVPAAKKGITFVFADLWETSDVERATIRKTDAETDAAYVNMGAIGNDEVRQRLADDEDGAYYGLTGAAPESDDEDEDDADDPPPAA